MVVSGSKLMMQQPKLAGFTRDNRRYDMVAQAAAKGLRPHVLRRLLCFSLFWHALDIIWVGVFTMVYLIGAG